MNKILLIGRLTRDPEIRYTSTGTPSAKFGLAVDRKFKDKGGKKTTDFFDVEAWGKLAELCGNHLDKGRQVAIEGEMRRDEWTDKEGQKRTSWKVNADTVEFLGSRDDAVKLRPMEDEEIRLNEVGERDIDEELERQTPYGF